MLVIRREQQEAMRSALRARFEARMVAHLGRFFPMICAALGDAETLQAIRDGIERAERHGISSGPDICLYIDVMFAFGREFDEDPSLPWARAILDRPGKHRRKAKLLFDTALHHPDQARGLDARAPR
jgi:hypothetical protein